MGLKHSCVVWKCEIYYVIISTGVNISYAKHPSVLKQKAFTLCNPELDSKHPLGMDLRAEGRCFYQVAHGQGGAWLKPALHQ